VPLTGPNHGSDWKKRLKNKIMKGFVEEQCFKFGMKELWRDSKR